MRAHKNRRLIRHYFHGESKMIQNLNRFRIKMDSVPMDAETNNLSQEQARADRDDYFPVITYPCSFVVRSASFTRSGSPFGSRAFSMDIERSRARSMMAG